MNTHLGEYLGDGWAENLITSCRIFPVFASFVNPVHGRGPSQCDQILRSVRVHGTDQAHLL